MRTLYRIVALLLGSAIAVNAQVPTQDRPEDAAAIRSHIESIFQAFIDKDLPALARTHSENWRGSSMDRRESFGATMDT